MSLTAREQALLDSGHYSVSLQVLAQDGSLNWHDLTNLGANASGDLGVDMVNSVEWGENIDDACAAATVRLKREIDDLSLSPLMADSPANREFNPGSVFYALLDVNRPIEIYAAVHASDSAPDATDYRIRFKGRIDTHNFGEEEIVLDCRDDAGELADRMIEKEKVYGYTYTLYSTNLPVGAYYAARVWQPSTSYVLGERVISPNDDGEVYVVSTAGTTAATPPATWTGATITSGGVVLTREGYDGGVAVPIEALIESVLKDTFPSLSLYTPVSPSTNIYPRQVEVKRGQPLLDALRDIARQIGWDFRYAYDGAAFQYTFFLPDRTKTTPDFELTSNQVLKTPTAKKSIENIRNVVRVWYCDVGDLDFQQKPKRKYVEVSDSTSILRYGRRYMEIPEDAVDGIDTSAEATALANAALSDLKDPIAEYEVETHVLDWAALGQLVRLKADGVRHSSDQDLAAAGYTHSIEGSEHRTLLELRGKPAAAWKYWQRISADPGRYPVKVIAAYPANPMTLTLTPVVSGLKVSVSQTQTMNVAAIDGYEIHASESSGFTPSGSTKKATTKGGEAELQDLTPGKTYYVKALPILSSGGAPVPALPSEQSSAVAGRATPNHLEPENRYGLLPLNGDFESPSTAGAEPDHWTVETGTWNTDLSRGSADGQQTGLQAIKFTTTATVQTAIASHYLLVQPSTSYDVGAFFKKLTGVAGRGAEILVRWYTSAKSLISTSSVGNDISAQDTTNFYPLSATFTSPSTAKWAKVLIRKDGVVAEAFVLDAVSFRPSAEGPVTLASVGVSPNAQGASLSGQVLTLQPASGSQPGLVTAGTQTIAGNKTFSGTIGASNFSGTSSGTNTGDVSLGAVGSSPNANGASLSGQALTLQPASSSQPGVVTAAAQTFGGAKTFNDGIVAESWHNVGAGGEPAFTNSWVNYDGGTSFPVAAFYKDPTGRVFLKGMIKSGTVGTTVSTAKAFTLPAGSRPTKDTPFATVANGAFAYGWVRSTGEVQPESGSNAWWSLDGISFRTS